MSLNYRVTVVIESVVVFKLHFFWMLQLECYAGDTVATVTLELIFKSPYPRFEKFV